MCVDALDLEREKKIGLGASFDLPDLKYGECYLPYRQIKYLDVKVGDQVAL